MIFLPNKFELYISLLRNTLQVLILKNGIKPKYLKNLKKIHIAEALFTNHTEPTNIKDFSIEILKAVFLKKLDTGADFKFSVDRVGTFLINRKLFASLLLTVSISADNVAVKNFKNKILISFKENCTANLEKHLKKLNGYSIKEIKGNTNYILISPQKTDKEPRSNEKDWEYILNPLSVVNIYLN